MTYKALVCLNLSGGNDSLNTFVPINNADALRSYTKYSAVRAGLSIPQNSLLPLNGSNLGMNPRLSHLASQYNAGNVALVHNVGPITSLQTVAQANAGQKPMGLFSHSDQTYQWDTAATNSEYVIGWGGKSTEEFLSNTVVSFASGARFGDGSTTKALVLPLPGSSFALRSWDGQPANAAIRFAALEQVINATQPASFLEAELKNQQLAALDLSEQLNDLIKRQPGEAGSDAAIDAAFNNLQGVNNTSISRQLYQVVKFLAPAGRSKLPGSAHIFYVRHEGFDTHGGQAVTHSDLLDSLNAALQSFTAAVTALGLQNNVTLFSTSEFGRTFKPNASNGTDHAWGASHFVMGGAVRGGAEYGTHPELTLGGPNDIEQFGPGGSNGRFMPTLSVSQYAATLVKWLSPASDMNAALPNLSAFAQKNIGFMDGALSVSYVTSGQNVSATANSTDTNITSVMATLVMQPAGTNVGPYAMTLNSSGSYVYNFTSVPPATYVLKVDVTANGVTTAESSAQFTVGSTACTPPSINAAGTISFSATTGVSNSFPSQSLPTVTPASPAGTWSKFSGPAWVSIAPNGSVSIPTSAVGGNFTAVRGYSNGCAPDLYQTLDFTVVDNSGLNPVITTGGTASANAPCLYTLCVGNLFDQNDLSKYQALAQSTMSPSSVSNPGGLEVVYELAPGVTSYATSYNITSASDFYGAHAPKDWRVQGWNGVAWVTLDTRTNQVFGVPSLEKTYQISGNNSLIFSKYKLIVDQNAGNTASSAGGLGDIIFAEFAVRGVTNVNCTSPTITTTGTTSFSGVSGTANSFASQVLPVASPSSPATTWTKFGGPAWITIGSNGAASISPAAPVGTFTAVREGSNGCAPNLQQTLTFVISAAPCVAPTLTSAGTTSFSGTAGIGNAFGAQVLPVVNSTPAGSWTKTSGPAWVAFGSNRSASITSAATAGTSTATATYSNGCAPDIVQTLTFVIASAAVAPDVQGPLPSGTVGQPYSTVLTTTGSPTAITITAPAGYSAAFVSGAWVLSGPASSGAGTVSVDFQLTNAASSAPVNKSLPLTIAAAPVVGAIGAMGPYLLAAGSNVLYTIPQTGVTGLVVSGAPAWATIVGGNLQLVPPAGTSGSFAFTVNGVSNGNPVTQNITVIVGQLEGNLVRLRRGTKSILTRLFKVV